MRRSQIGFDLIRRFTVQSFYICDLLALSLGDLLNMRLEFEKIFKQLFRTAKERLRRELVLKIEAVTTSERLAVIQEAKGTDKFKSMFAYAFLGGLLKNLKDAKDENIPLDEISLQRTQVPKIIKQSDRNNELNLQPCTLNEASGMLSKDNNLISNSLSKTLMLHNSKLSQPQNDCKFCRSVLGECGCPEVEDIVEVNRRAEKVVLQEGVSSDLLSGSHNRPLNAMESSNIQTYKGYPDSNVPEGTLSAKMEEAVTAPNGFISMLQRTA